MPIVAKCYIGCTQNLSTSVSQGFEATFDAPKEGKIVITDVKMPLTKWTLGKMGFQSLDMQAFRKGYVGM